MNEAKRKLASELADICESSANVTSDYRVQIRDFLRELSQAPSVVDGWQLAPKKPTEEMCISGAYAMLIGAWGSDGAKASDIYIAMLAAAPKQNEE